MALPQLFVTIGAKVDGFEKAMGTISQRLNAVDREASRAFSGFDKLADRIGTVATAAGTALTAGITAPLGLISAASVSAAGTFETSFNKIQALGDNVTGPALERLRQLALKLGADTKFSAQEAADGMAVFASSGYSTEQILAVMPGTLSLAAAGMTTIADAALITKNTLNQFGLEASNAGMVADVLAQISQDTSANMSDLGLTLNYVGPIASGMGQSLHEVGAAMVALDKAGIQAEKAGTGLRGVLGSLSNPSDEAAAALIRLKVSIADSQGNIKPISAIMEQFKVGLAGIGTEAERSQLLFDIFGREAATSAQILINTGGPKLDEFEQKLINSEGAAKKMADTMNRGLGFSLDQLKGIVETAAITLGTALLPVVTKVIDHGTRLVNEFVIPAAKWFGTLPDSVQLTVIAIAGVAAAIGPLLFLGGQLAISITALLPAFTSLAGAFGLTATAAGTAGAAAGTAAGATGLGALATAIPPVALLIGSLGIAWAAWKFQDDIPGILLLKLGFDALSAAIGLQVDFVKWLAKGFVDLISPMTGAGDVIKTLLTPQRLLLEGFQSLTSAMRGMRVEVESLAKPSDLASKALKNLNDKSDPIGKSALLAANGLDAFGRPVKQLTTELPKMGTAAGEAGGKVGELGKETGLLHPKNELLYAMLGSLTAAHNKAVSAIAAYKLKLFEGKVETVNFTTVLGDLQAMVGNVDTKLSDVSNITMPPFLARMNQLTPPTDTFREALAKLGITGSYDLQKVASEAALARDVVLGSNLATDFEKKTAIYKALKAQVQAAQDSGIGVKAEQLKTLETMEAELSTGKGQSVVEASKGLFTQVSTVITNFAQDAAKILFDGEMSWGEKVKAMWGKLKEAVVSTFIEPATKALSDFVSGVLADLIGGKGFGGIFARVGDIGKSVKDIIGIGGNAAGGVAGAAGGASGAASGVSGAAGGASSLLSTLTGAGALGSFATGIIGAFQNARQENTLNAIEESTRFTAIGTIGAGGIIDTLRTYMPWLENIAQFNYAVAAPWMAHMQSWTEPGGQWFDRTVQMIDLIAQRVVAPLDLLAMAVTPGADGSSSMLNVRVFLDGKELSNAITAADELGGGAI